MNRTEFYTVRRIILDELAHEDKRRKMEDEL